MPPIAFLAPGTGPAAVVVAAAGGAAVVLGWQARRHPGPLRAVYAVVALALAAAACGEAVRCTPGVAWPAALAVAAAAVGVLLPRRLADAETDRAEDAARLAILEAAVAASWDGVMIAAADPADPGGLRVVYANPAFERLTGYSVAEAAGLSPSVFCRPTDPGCPHLYTPDPDDEAAAAALAAVRAALGGNTPARLEVPSRRKDGGRVWAEWQVVPVAGPDGRPTHRVAVIRDTTDRRRLEGQLRESQKLEAVGRLAGGIAHDFNNLLTVIRGNAELVADAPEAAPVADLVDDIRGAADRATGLVRQLLAFGRRQPARPVVLDLNEAVAETAGMLRRLLGERVTVVAAPSEHPVRTRIDRGQFEQVVMNLAVNAKDAMPAGGTVLIATAAAPADGPARFARLAVSDTGVGIPAGVREKIFEPFFTTKDVGQGTGLGLATVYGIVQQAGGRVGVESAAGAGTTFRVDLPWCDDPAEPRSGGYATPAPAARPPAGRGRGVLLAEDEDGVRKLAKAAFESAGYVVADAATGEDALALLAAAAVVDVLVTDLTMPGMGGVELARRVRAARPAAGVVFISGYHADLGRLDATPGAVFLPKPFTPHDLVRAAGRAAARATRPPAAV